MRSAHQAMAPGVRETLRLALTGFGSLRLLLEETIEQSTQSEVL